MDCRDIGQLVGLGSARLDSTWAQARAQARLGLGLGLGLGDQDWSAARLTPGIIGSDSRAFNRVLILNAKMTGLFFSLHPVAYASSIYHTLTPIMR